MSATRSAAGPLLRLILCVLPRPVSPQVLEAYEYWYSERNTEHTALTALRSTEGMALWCCLSLPAATFPPFQFEYLSCKSSLHLNHPSRYPASRIPDLIADLGGLASGWAGGQSGVDSRLETRMPVFPRDLFLLVQQRPATWEIRRKNHGLCAGQHRTIGALRRAVSCCALLCRPAPPCIRRLRTCISPYKSSNAADGGYPP